MEDRLTELLNIVMEQTDDDKVKALCQDIIDIDEEASSYDFSDWENIRLQSDYIADIINTLKEDLK